MKHTTLLKYISACFLVMAIAFNFSSCIDDNEWDVDSAHSRMHRPVTFETASVGATNVALRFSKINGTRSYVIEFSEDSLEFNSIVRTEELSADTMTFDNSSTTPRYVAPFSRLKAATQYSARIKTTSKKDGIADSEWAVLAFKTPGENILTGISPSDITDRSVILKWSAGSDVTHIILTPSDGGAVRVDLNQDDINTGMKYIDGLTADMPYVAEIYNESVKRGERSFATNESVPTDGVVYQLNGGEDIVEFLNNITDNNIILVFPEGSSYVAGWSNEAGEPQTTLPLKDNVRSITFWGPDNGRASLQATSIKMGIAMGKMIFRNMELKGVSSASDYVINESATHTISEISFDGCEIHTVRGILRMQNAANMSNIDKVRFNNCIVHDIGGYGIVNGAVANGGIRYANVTIENSTFYNVSEIVCAFYTPVSNSFVLKNCTFYNSIGNGRQIVNFNGDAGNIPPTFEIVNCIFGKFYYSGNYVENTSIRATNPKMTDPFASETYKTSDFIINTGYPLSGVTEYSGSSTDLFQDPENANFKIKDTGFPGAGSAGDPRWW